MNETNKQQNQIRENRRKINTKVKSDTREGVDENP